MLPSLLLVCAAAAAASHPPHFVLEEHPTLRFSKNTFILGRMRWDYEHRGPETSLPAGKDEWGFVRRRLSVEGGIGGVILYEIESDLTGPERWKDVYAEYARHPAAHVRAGKFVLPFGYERTTSLDVLDFAYRSMAGTLLVPPRDRGVMVFGALPNRTVTYEAGWFEDGDTLAARVVDRNVSLGMPGRFEFGAAVTYGDLGSEMAPLRGATALGVPFFASPRFESGHRRRVSVHGVYRTGAAAVKAEFVGNHDGPGRGAAALDAGSWYVSGSYVLTGESEADAHHPKHPLFRGGIGSIELAARTERITFETGPSHTTAREHMLGLNWQPIRFFRIQLNAIRDEIPGHDMWAHVFRMHLTI